MDLSNFEQLEARIYKLIEQNTSLKKQNRILHEKLYQKDQDIHKLNDNIGKFNQERTLAYTKVVDLIEKIEDIVVYD